FMLDRSPYLMQFVDYVTRINRGRAFFAEPGRLGDYLLVDYVANRRRRVGWRSEPPPANPDLDMRTGRLVGLNRPLVPLVSPPAPGGVQRIIHPGGEWPCWRGTEARAPGAGLADRPGHPRDPRPERAAVEEVAREFERGKATLIYTAGTTITPR